MKKKEIKNSKRVDKIMRLFKKLKEVTPESGMHLTVHAKHTQEEFDKTFTRIIHDEDESTRGFTTWVKDDVTFFS